VVEEKAIMTTSSFASAASKLASSASATPYPLEDLPIDSNDELWKEIRSTYGLNLPELAALKNHVRQQQQQQKESVAYLVHVRILGAVRSNGARGNVFKFLERHMGHFSRKDGIQILYDPNGNLSATAYFLTYESACQFQNSMNEWEIHKELANLRGVEIDPITPQQVPNPLDLVRIRLQDYQPQASESPCQSINQIHSYRLSVPVTEAVDPTTELAKYQSIDKLLPHLQHYKCHLKNKSKFKELRNDENNIVAASWIFHQLLDGLNTAEGIPLVLLSVKSASDHRIAAQGNRVLVTLNLEFFFQENAAAFAASEGARKVDDMNWETVIFVKDRDQFQKCVEWKYGVTKTAWDQHRHFLADE
jgi:hypothetical protein